MNNYVPYHVHTMLSNGVTNIDSITDFHAYVDLAKSLGMKSMAFSEHGSLFAWLKKKEYIESCGMKYIHAIEAYLTDDTPGCEKKTRDNYHVVLIAKNYQGVTELNKLISKSFCRSDFHVYYMPRISFSELYDTSDNIIVTSACLGGALHNGTDFAKEKFLNFLCKNKHRCFLEIQHHNCEEQIEYNRMLYQLHQQMGIPLIAGSDTHALDNLHMDGRAVLQKAKNVHFSNEDAWDLKFKSFDDLLSAYYMQQSIPMEAVKDAVNNTNLMADMVEPFTVDYSPKYPVLYADSDAVFKQKVNEGVVKRGIMNYPNYREYVDRIRYEYETYKHNGAIDFMLLEENYKTEMRKCGVKYGYSRGSVSGSIIAYLLYITEIDSVKYNLNFERFMNTERVSLADVDTDWYSEDRKAVKDYLYGKDGLYCCDIVTFNTIKLRGAIKDVCRGLYKDGDRSEYESLTPRLKKMYDEYEEKCLADPDEDCEMPKELKAAIDKSGSKGYLHLSEEIIAAAEENEEKARGKYPEVFKYVDLVKDVVVSVGNHPAGCVVSPFPVDEWFGTFTTKTNDYPIAMLNMKEIDSLNFVKLDILGLDNVGLIYKTCEAADIPYATPDNIPPDDEEVWKSIAEDTTMIFQWESQSATAYLRQLFSPHTIEKIKERNPDMSYIDLLSIGNGAIRPAGDSYRDQLANGEYRDNGHAALNEFLAPTLGYLVYQEQVIEFLHKFCGYTMGEADIVRRGFAKKTGTEQFIPKIKDGFIKTMREQYGVEKEEAEVLIVNFINVIEDASAYLFSKNHSDPYSWIGYICGYLRFHYPLEFITTALNIFEGKEDKSTAIINYAKKNGIKISPIRFRHSVAKYSFDKDTNTIFKGISSIKFMNQKTADDLYALRNNKYPQFTNLLYDLKDKRIVNTRQLKILIQLDFFSEFGEPNKLLKITEMFETYSDKVQIRKDKLNTDLYNKVKEYAGKETDKMFTQFFSKDFLLDAEQDVRAKPMSLKERASAQLEYLGYIDIMDERYAGMAVVMKVDTKYAPRLSLYSLKNGTISECKIDKRTYNKMPLGTGDVIRINSWKRKPKVKKNPETGEWDPIPNTSEIWLSKYVAV